MEIQQKNHFRLRYMFGKFLLLSFLWNILLVLWGCSKITQNGVTSNTDSVKVYCRNWDATCYLTGLFPVGENYPTPDTIFPDTGQSKVIINYIKILREFNNISRQQVSIDERIGIIIKRNNMRSDTILIGKNFTYLRGNYYESNDDITKKIALVCNPKCKPGNSLNKMDIQWIESKLRGMGKR